MPAFTCDYKHLDSDTRGYLEAVARQKGRGAPGIFLPGTTNAWPVISLIIGGLVLFFGLGFTLAMPKAPMASAMLLTAAVLLGGWMVLYPIRRWFGGGLGNFQYFDPHTVYESNNRDVTVTDVSQRTDMEFTENYNDGKYVSTTLHFHGPGKSQTATIKNRNKAAFVSDYYGNLFTLENDENYSKYSVAEAGALARYIAKEGAPPDDIKLVDLDINELPAKPSSSKTGGFAMSFLVIPATALGIFLISWAFLSPMQDAIAFSEAEKNGVQGYRDYLLDARNTSNRDAAKAKIKELYKPVIEKAANCPNADERRAWTELLTALSELETLPVVSIAVSGNPQFDKDLKTWLADSLGSYFGPAYVSFVENPPEAKPMIECKYTDTNGTIRWTMIYRQSPDAADAEAITIPERTSASNMAPLNNPLGGVVITGPGGSAYPPGHFKENFFKMVFNTTQPTIFQQPTGDTGD